MKKALLFFLALVLSFQVTAHCGSCGEGGSAEDHAESEDKEHHDKDARYDAAREREEAIKSEGEGEEREEDDMNE